MGTLTILEPMSTGDIIDRAVRFYRRNFAPLVAIVAVPSLIGYVSGVLFWFGYTDLLLNMERSPGATRSAGDALVALFMLGAGCMGYIAWLFVWIMTVSGLSRVVSDSVMLNEPLTFRRCFQSVRSRLGDIMLMGLLMIVITVVVTMIFYLLIIILVLIVGVLAALMAAAALPPWMSGVLMAVLVLAGVAASVFLILVVVSRVVFLPQVVMIEGQSAGSGIGRAIRLGGGNWYKVGGIALFTYFVSASLLAALTLPVMAVLYLLDIITAEFLVSPTWNVVYSAFGQLSNLLVLPIWIVSFTLLYFDSRVRREAYDIELLAREITPGFYWQPHRQQVSSAPVEPAAACKSCGEALQAGASFCIRCGQPTLAVVDSI